MAQGTFTAGVISGLIGTGLDNGWILPSSSFSGKPYGEGRLECCELRRRQIPS